jgi:hypothetical protein
MYAIVFAPILANQATLLIPMIALALAQELAPMDKS